MIDYSQVKLNEIKGKLKHYIKLKGGVSRPLKNLNQSPKMFALGNAADCLVSDGYGSAHREIRQSLGVIPETCLGDRCVGADTSVSLRCR